jgi:hypothetical protein
MPKNISDFEHKTPVLSLVSYGLETWSLVLEEPHRWGVIESMKLRELFYKKENK